MPKVPTTVRTVDRQITAVGGLQPGEDDGNAQIPVVRQRLGERVKSTPIATDAMDTAPA
jgi:hypothetical protein